MSVFSTAYENYKIRYEQALAKRDKITKEPLQEGLVSLNANWVLWMLGHLNGDTDLQNRAGTRMLEILNLVGTVSVGEIENPTVATLNFNHTTVTQSITVGANQVSNPFDSLVAYQVYIKDNNRKEILGLYPTYPSTTTGDITFESGVAYTDAIFEVWGK